MIYTSYFAKIKELEVNDIVPIAICGGIPDYYHGLWYRKVAPKWDWFQQWKQNHDNDFYIKKFNETVLNAKDQWTVATELQALAPGKDIALICYEKPEDFCHRHLVADWLNKAGYEVKEWTNN